MSYLEITDAARCAYAAIAPVYDRFTAGACYENWLSQIEARALDLGLTGGRLLDIACGTGESFAPLLARGYQVSGCDLSPEMLDQARRKFGHQVDDLFVADMRDLPPVGAFDLVTCIDDALNYLLSEEELVSTFEGVAQVLAPEAIFVFDVNSLSSYRTTGGETFLREDDGGLFCWQGETDASIQAGDIASVRIEAFIEVEDALWQRVSSRHVQRHHPRAVIENALEAAGLKCAAAAGQRPGGNLEDHVDEDVHIKVVYFARLRPRGERG